MEGKLLPIHSEAFEGVSLWQISVSDDVPDIEDNIWVPRDEPALELTRASEEDLRDRD